MRQIKSYLLSFAIVAVLATAFSQVHGYAEHTYRCAVAGNSITVSIKTGEQLCFTYIAAIQEKILDHEEEISQAQYYISQNRQTLYR